MSEISIFRTAFILPRAMGKLVNQLHDAVEGMLAPRQRQMHWHTLGERELKLREAYFEVKGQSAPSRLTGFSSQALDSLTRQHDHLKAMITAINEVPVMTLNLSPNHQWAKCQKDVQTIGQAVSTQRLIPEIFDLVSQTDTRIRQLTLNSHRKLALAEKNVVGSLTVDTLRSLGYRLKAKGHTLLGNNGETSLRAKIEMGGGLVLDTTAFNGMACHKEVARIESALKERGVVLQRVGGGAKVRTQGVLLQDPFPPLNHCTKSAPMKIHSGTDRKIQDRAAKWVKTQRQYHQQRLPLKEG